VKLPRGRMTNGLAIVAAVLFVLLWAGGMIDNAAILGGFIPLRATDAAAYLALGGSADAAPVWLTPLTATLVHASWYHLGFNLLMLLFCGRHVEHVTGPWLMLLLYGVGAYAAAGAEWVLAPHSASPMVGASGAISALLGTYALLYSQQNVKAYGPFSANVVRLAWLAAAWTAVQLLIGFAMRGVNGELGHIAIGAHIGGFLAGLLLTRPVLKLRFRGRFVEVD
jgi:membrane associated rhomboid family serine protease